MQLTMALSLAYSSWTFDAYLLTEASQGHPLSTLGYYRAWLQAAANMLLIQRCT